MPTKSKKKRLAAEREMVEAGEIRAADVEVLPADKPAPARPRPRSRSRRKVSPGRAVKAVGALAALGTAIAAQKMKNTVRRAIGEGRRAAGTRGAMKTVAKTAGKAALAAGVSAAVRATAEELRRRR
jgi:hypothetical protein